MKKILFLALITFSGLNFSQSKFDYFPSSLNVQPFTANMLEPKLGFLFQFDKNELRLDVGNSMDILHYDMGNDQKLSFGADLFTYTLLRGETDFHFPVDAVDYLFGVNFGYKKNENDFEYGARLRISHISAHFVDGHFDGTNGHWRDYHNPIVYSREFTEFIPYVKYENIRAYVGYTYLFHVDPTYIGKNNYQAGFEYFAKELINPFITPFAGYDIKLIKNEKYTANNSVLLGIKLGNPDSRGVSIYYQYYSGKSIHGEYFDFNKKYSAFGINLDL